jgi:hypothetical protein
MIYKQKVIWNKATEKPPEIGRRYLAWDGKSIFVCDGDLILVGIDYSVAKDLYWSELPLAPGEENPPPPDPYEGMVARNIYLKLNDEIVGLHAIGYEHEGVFDQVDVWGNVYDEDHNMLGRGSFRVHNDIEVEAKSWEADGWSRYDGPRKKTT